MSEETIIDATDVDLPRFAADRGFERFLPVEWDAEVPREMVIGPHGDHAEDRLGVDDGLEDVADRAVAPRGDEKPDTAGHPFTNCFRAVGLPCEVDHFEARLLRRRLQRLEICSRELRTRRGIEEERSLAGRQFSTPRERLNA